MYVSVYRLECWETAGTTGRDSGAGGQSLPSQARQAKPWPSFAEKVKGTLELQNDQRPAPAERARAALPLHLPSTPAQTLFPLLSLDHLTSTASLPPTPPPHPTHPTPHPQTHAAHEIARVVSLTSLDLLSCPVRPLRSALSPTSGPVIPKTQFRPPAFVPVRHPTYLSQLQLGKCPDTDCRCSHNTLLTPPTLPPSTPTFSTSSNTMSADDVSSPPLDSGVDNIADRLGGLNTADGGVIERPQNDEEYGQAQLTLRAIVTSKEAGVIIGKAGQNVADLRDKTGVRAGVSKVVPGVHDRVLTVTGALNGVGHAYGLVADCLLKGAPQVGMGGVVASPNTHPIRLLISHNQMGTIIGRQGLKIKQIQDESGVRMVAQKEMLPQSTERIVEVQGTPDGVQKAVWEIGKCLIDDQERGYGTVLYSPAVRVQGGPAAGPMNGTGYGAPRSFNRTGNGADFTSGYAPRPRNGPPMDAGGPPPVVEEGEDIQTQNISIPADMVGCIIGRAGSKISEIRRSSGARISIAKAPHDETGERMFTITGGQSANEKALYLLYENLENEKMRRSQIPDAEA
ncbi:hypothetical protein D0863_02724 [Hortaea werneckii]|uniref:K Homology domain-containing protein n=1 Tax=Hortaea werneckii TaxID=91943 RepID=A0A3M7EF74_HORWE|nr:hypothetical protein D0863_02724 [Hortaea werneckii]